MDAGSEAKPLPFFFLALFLLGVIVMLSGWRERATGYDFSRPRHAPVSWGPRRISGHEAVRDMICGAILASAGLAGSIALRREKGKSPHLR